MMILKLITLIALVEPSDAMFGFRTIGRLFGGGNKKSKNPKVAAPRQSVQGVLDAEFPGILGEMKKHYDALLLEKKSEDEIFELFKKGEGEFQHYAPRLKIFKKKLQTVNKYMKKYQSGLSGAELTIERLPNIKQRLDHVWRVCKNWEEVKMHLSNQGYDKSLIQKNIDRKIKEMKEMEAQSVSGSVGSSSKFSSNFAGSSVAALPSVPDTVDIMSYGGHNTRALSVDDDSVGIPEITTELPPPVALEKEQSLVPGKQQVPVNCKRLFESEQKCKMNNLNEAQKQILYKYYDEIRNKKGNMEVYDFYHKLNNYRAKDKGAMDSLLKKAYMDNYMYWDWGNEVTENELGRLIKYADTDEFKAFVKIQDAIKSTEQLKESEEEKAEQIFRNKDTNADGVEEAVRRNLERKQIETEYRDVLKILDEKLEGSGFAGGHFYELYLAYLKELGKKITSETPWQFSSRFCNGKLKKCKDKELTEKLEKLSDHIDEQYGSMKKKSDLLALLRKLDAVIQRRKEADENTKFTDRAKRLRPTYSPKLFSKELRFPEQTRVICPLGHGVVEKTGFRDGKLYYKIKLDEPVQGKHSWEVPIDEIHLPSEVCNLPLPIIN